jgi:hypothetical protein
MNPKIKTDFLVAQPCGAFGVGRFFDFAGTFDAYNVSRSEWEADARAIYSDWAIVGADMQIAVQRFGSSRDAAASAFVGCTHEKLLVK